MKKITILLAALFVILAVCADNITARDNPDMSYTGEARKRRFLLTSE
jgi:preprotein translocase subunit SecG